MRRALVFAPVLAGWPSAAHAQAPAAPPAYHLATRWQPGAGGGGGGRLTLDPPAGRLYVARADGVEIINTANGALVRRIPGLEEGREVALAPELNRGFATSAASAEVLVFDLTSLRPAGAPVKVGKDPGAVVYEPLTRRVFVCHGGGEVSVIDAVAGAVLATIPLGGTPECAATDGQGVVFVALKDKNEVVVIDARANTTARRWPLAPGAEPTDITLDPVRHRLLCGCRNGRLIVLDAQKGRHLAEVSLGRAVEACAVDPGSGTLYAACAGGTLAVVQEDPAAPGGFRVVETIHTPGPGALAFDPRTHAIFLAANAAGGEPRAAGNGEPPRPAEQAEQGFAILKFTR